MTCVLLLAAPGFPASRQHRQPSGSWGGRACALPRIGRMLVCLYVCHASNCCPDAGVPRYLVQQARALGLTVLDRCNLTGGSACCAAAVRWDASGELCPLSALVRRATCALPATKNAPYLRASHAYLFVPMNARSRQAVHSAHHVGISSA
eukprot:364965-Chlamydomonas_euryale.AAC.18